MSNVSDPGKYAVAVTPHDSTNLVATTRALYVGSAGGNITAIVNGTAITFVNQNGAGVVTITSTDTVRLAGTGVTSNKFLAANGVATALKVTATEWLISGTGLTT